MDWYSSKAITLFVPPWSICSLAVLRWDIKIISFTWLAWFAFYPPVFHLTNVFNWDFRGSSEMSLNAGSRGTSHPQERRSFSNSFVTGWRQRCLLFPIWFLHSSYGFYLKKGQGWERAVSGSKLHWELWCIQAILSLNWRVSPAQLCPLFMVWPPHVSPAHFPLSPSSELRFYCQHHLLTQVLHAKPSLISTICCSFYSIQYTKETPAV